MRSKRLGGDLYVIDGGVRLRNGLTDCPHDLEVFSQSRLKVAASFFFRVANRYASGNVR